MNLRESNTHIINFFPYQSIVQAIQLSIHLKIKNYLKKMNIQIWLWVVDKIAKKISKTDDPINTKINVFFSKKSKSLCFN